MVPRSWIDPTMLRTLEGNGPTSYPKGTTMTTTTATTRSSFSRLLHRLDGYTLWAFNSDAALGGRRTRR